MLVRGICAIVFLGIPYEFVFAARTRTWSQIHDRDKGKPKLKTETSVENYLQNIQLGLLRPNEAKKKRETIVKINIHLFSSILSGFIRLRLSDSAFKCRKKEWVVQLEIRLYFAHFHCSQSKWTFQKKWLKTARLAFAVSRFIIFFLFNSSLGLFTCVNLTFTNGLFKSSLTSWKESGVEHAEEFPLVTINRAD